MLQHTVSCITSCNHAVSYIRHPYIDRHWEKWENMHMSSHICQLLQIFRQTLLAKWQNTVCEAMTWSLRVVQAHCIDSKLG